MLAFYSFWPDIDTNTIEQLIEKVKRRSYKMGAAFRDEESCLLMFYAVIIGVRFQKLTMPMIQYQDLIYCLSLLALTAVKGFRHRFCYHYDRGTVMVGFVRGTTMGSDDFREGFQRLLDLYQVRGLDWIAPSKHWIQDLSEVDHILWMFALRANASTAIVDRLKAKNLYQDQKPEDITQRVLQLQRSYLDMLVDNLGK